MHTLASSTFSEPGSKSEIKKASQFRERKLVAKQIIYQEREVKCEICFNFPNFGK